MGFDIVSLKQKILELGYNTQTPVRIYHSIEMKRDDKLCIGEYYNFLSDGTYKKYHIMSDGDDITYHKVCIEEGRIQYPALDYNYQKVNDEYVSLTLYLQPDVSFDNSIMLGNTHAFGQCFSHTLMNKRVDTCNCNEAKQEIEFIRDYFNHKDIETLGNILMIFLGYFQLLKYQDAVEID